MVTAHADVADHQLTGGAPGSERGCRGCGMPKPTVTENPFYLLESLIGLTRSAVTVKSMYLTTRTKTT